MEDHGFGAKLRELRQQAGMTQKELADRVGIDFTYLSKLENEVMPPPSEKVILKLAEELNANKDELMLLAGKIPSDIAQVLKNGETLRFLRSDGTRKVIRASNKIRRNVETLELLRSEGAQKMIGASNKIRRSLQMFNYKKNFSRVAIASVLVLAVIGSLWFAAPIPTRALTMTVPDTTGTIGSIATITGTVIVENGDILPILSVDLEIYGGSYSETFTGLPLATVSGVAYTGTNSSTASISAVAGAGWGYGYGNRTGYGWGYLIGWGPSGGYHDLGTNTFGYGYYPAITGVGTSIAYTVVWSVPSNWATGSYTVRFRVHANNSVDFTEDGTLTLSRPVLVGGGGGVPTPTTPSGTTLVPTDSAGTFTTTTTAQSADAGVTITVDAGTQGLTAEGTPLQEITIQPIADAPAPEGATVIDEAGTIISTVGDITFIGIPYEFGPSGATFSEPITITLDLPAELPADIDVSNLRVGWWNAAANSWVILETTYDPATNTLTALADHFSIFTVIAVPPVVEPPVVEPPVVEPPVVEPPVVEPPVVEPPVVEPPVVEPPVVEPPTPVEEGIGWWVWLIVGIAVVAVIVGVVIWRRRAY